MKTHISERLSLLALALLSLSACQSAPTSNSGFLSSYEGLKPSGDSVRATILAKRDDQTVMAIDKVHITPATLHTGVGTDLTPEEQRLVLTEVDRQICFELSERFTLLPAPDPQAATVRTTVTRIDKTGTVGSGASAALNVFNPIPGLKLRSPGSTGALAVESEMLSPENTQIAAITWAREAKVVGTDAPSLSRVGDALQLAEPMGDAVAAAFAPPNRPARKIEGEDPCNAYGPRNRNIGNTAVGIFTGLYVPTDTPAKSE